MGIPTLLLWQTKENFYNINKTLGSKNKYLIGYAYDDNVNGYMKWTYINLNKRKTIWTLGSSRVLQFRANMFTTSFYNAGYTASRIKEFRPFLRSIPDDKLPDYILIGLDQWMFNEAWDNVSITPEESLWKNNFSFYPKPYPLYRTVYEDIFSGKYSFKALREKSSIQKIGINAVMGNTGFRNDGSLFYGAQIAKLIQNDKTVKDYGFSETFQRIQQGNNRFEYGKEVNKKAIAELEKLLDYCHNKHITIVAFLPPFADAVYTKMMDSNHYTYMKKIFDEIKPLFLKYDYELYDLSTVSFFDSNNREMIDGFHGSEVTYQKCLIQMLKNGSVLNKNCNLKKLERDLIKKKNNYTVYDY